MGCLWFEFCLWSFVVKMCFIGWMIVVTWILDFVTMFPICLCLLFGLCLFDWFD